MLTVTEGNENCIHFWTVYWILLRLKIHYTSDILYKILSSCGKISLQ